MTSREKHATGIGIFHFAIYMLNGSCIHQGDPTASSFTARNIVQHLEPFLDRLVGSPGDLVKYNLVSSGDGHIFSGFGLGTPIAAAPVYLAAELAGVPWDFYTTHFVGKVAAALMTAISVASLYAILARYVPNGTSLMLSACYGLGTLAWSTLSQGLWQQSVAAFLLICALWLLTLPAAGHSAVCWAGFLLAFAVLSRPTHLIGFVVCAAFVLKRSTRQGMAFLAGALPVLCVLALWNNAAYGGVFNTGQDVLGATIAPFKTGASTIWHSPLPGAAGLLFSPSRGILFFCPFLFAAVPGALRIRNVEDHAFKELLHMALCISSAIFLVSSAYFDWWGGWSYGPRYMADISSLLVILAAPVVAGIERSWWRGVFSATVVWSILVQGVGAFCSNFEEWNCGTPQHPNEDIDKHHERLWALEDSQIFFHLRDRQLKPGLLGESTCPPRKIPGC